MDLDQAGAGGENVGRSDAFYQGQNGSPGSIASTMNKDSSWINAQVAGMSQSPQSVLQFHYPSGNGMSAQDAENKYYGLGTGNGGYYSKSAYGNAMGARMQQMSKPAAPVVQPVKNN